MHIYYVSGIFRYLDFVHTYTGIFKNTFFPPPVMKISHPHQPYENTNAGCQVQQFSKNFIFSDLKLCVRLRQSDSQHESPNAKSSQSRQAGLL